MHLRAFLEQGQCCFCSKLPAVHRSKDNYVLIRVLPILEKDHLKPLAKAVGVGGVFVIRWSSRTALGACR